MTNAKITYQCSEEGRKAHLLAGLPGSSYQTISVPADHPYYAQVVRLAKLGYDGVPALDASVAKRHNDPHASVPPKEWDTVPTVEELLAEEALQSVRLEDEVRKAREESRIKTQGVLDARRTSTRVTYLGGVQYASHSPDWPYYADPEVKNSPEALAWVEELNRQNAEARATAEAETARKTEAEAENKRKAAEAEAERRAGLGLGEDDVDYAVEAHVLIEVPCWESHSRGKNWMATITLDPKAPGGLSRTFHDKARGDGYYILPDLEPGDALEFGADYYSGGGRKNEKRRYRVFVRAVLDADGNGHVVLRKADTGKAAVKLGEKVRKEAEKAAVQEAKVQEERKAVDALEACWNALQPLPEKEAKKVLAELKKRVSPPKNAPAV